MKRITLVLGLLLTASVAGVAGYLAGHRSHAAPEGDEKPATQADAEKPVAAVTVAAIVRRPIAPQIVAYGTVYAPPDQVRVLSVPFESRVTTLLVAPGEAVAAGQPVIEVQASAATLLALQEARLTRDAAQRDLKGVQQRFEQKLATNSDLFTAENAMRTSEGRLHSLEQGGAGGPQRLTAEFPGIVSKIDAQLGQVVPIATPLIELAARDKNEVRVEVEAADAVSLKPGQSVTVSVVGDANARAVAGTIRLIGQRADPATRRVEVLVTLPPDSSLLLDSYVTARIFGDPTVGLVVPRDAVLPADEGGYTLFTVKDAHAVKHSVTVGIENDTEAQVIADDIKEGDSVVVVGNRELDDGVEVRVQSTSLPATEPAMPTAPTSSDSDRPAVLTTSPETGPAAGTSAPGVAATRPTTDAEARP